MFNAVQTISALEALPSVILLNSFLSVAMLIPVENPIDFATSGFEVICKIVELTSFSI